jgi:membrane associated rhomboid family serine protease
MIPLRDDNPSESTPVVTRALIVMNAAIFFYELSLGPALHDFILSWGLVPARLQAGLNLGGDHMVRTGLTLGTSLFLHGGWAHLIGNMWYLWIFGDNVEDQFGSLGFLLFYLAAGAAASVLHVVSNPGSHLPTLGASGAIAGVLGAYAVMFPRARVYTLVPFFPIFQIIPLPAVLMLGAWFLFQFVAGAISAGQAAATGGVAWWAHIGGFLFGVIVAKATQPFRRRPRSHAEPVD